MGRRNLRFRRRKAAWNTPCSRPCRLRITGVYWTQKPFPYGSRITVQDSENSPAVSVNVSTTVAPSCARVWHIAECGDPDVAYAVRIYAREREVPDGRHRPLSVRWHPRSAPKEVCYSTAEPKIPPSHATSEVSCRERLPPSRSPAGACRFSDVGTQAIRHAGEGRLAGREPKSCRNAGGSEGGGSRGNHGFPRAARRP